MDFILLHRPVFIALFLLFLIPLLEGRAFAASSKGLKEIEQLEEDLAVIDAKIVVDKAGAYFLNKGDAQGIRKGDLWVVYGKGESLKDPVTGKLLGKTADALAYGIVTQVEEGFSRLRIRCLVPGCEIRNGLSAKRYKGISAFFYDLDGRYRPLYEWVRSNLPHLDWTWYQQVTEESEAQPEEDAVVMVAHRGRLTAWSGREISGLYGIPSALTEKAEISPFDRSISSKEAKRQTDYRVDTYDQMAVSMGLVENEEGPFLVYLASDTVYARSLNSTRVYTYNYKGFGQPLNISVGPEGLIAFNIFDKREGMKSRILKLTREGFATLVKDVDFILGFFDKNFDTTYETLLAQNWDEETFWGAGVYRFDISNGKLVNRKKVKVPDDFKMFGAFYSDLNGNKKPEIGYYNRKGRLCLFEDGKQIWESSIQMDGSIQVVQFDNPDDPELPVPDNKPVWPASALIKGKERQAVAVPVNSSDMWGTVGGAPEEGDVRMLYYTKVRFLFPSLPYHFGGPVQSVFIYDGKLYCTVVEGDVFRKKGKTHIFAYPLDEVLAHVI